MLTSVVARQLFRVSILLGSFTFRTAAQDCLVWTERTPPVPPAANNGSAIAFDSIRGVLVRFGGFSLGAVSGNTWEWDNRRWRLRSEPGPAPRVFHAMAFDAARGVTVLFGGRTDSTTYHNDTWEWDGHQWSLRSTTGPSPRTSHALVYDPIRGVVTLYGGVRSPNGLEDTWDWDATTWVQRDVAGPGPRVGHALAFDAGSGETLLFGGQPASGVYLGDTWSWNGTQWTLFDVEGPSPRASHTMAYDENSRRVLLHGGVDGVSIPPLLSDTWAWDGAEWVSFPSQARPPFFADMAFDAVRSRMVLLENGDRLWDWDGGAWERHEVSPRPRNNPAMAYDSKRHVTVLFGGEDRLDPNHGYLGDTWEWDGTDWTRRSTTGPSPRILHAMAYDLDRGVVVLHGGTAPQVEFGDTWEWDGNTWSDRTGKPDFDVRRYGHSMAFDQSRQVTVLVGGDRIPPVLEWDGTAWVYGFPSAFYGADSGGLAYDRVREVSVYFGPEGPYTYEWDGVNWSSDFIPGPPGRQHLAMVYDSAQEQTLMFGGYAAVVYEETWGWDGLGWTLRSNLGPGRRDLHAMAFASDRGVSVLFGGNHHSAGQTDDTWELGPGTLAGDVDGDCDIDLREVAHAVNCIGNDPTSGSCARLDADGNGTVEAAEVTVPLSRLRGPIR